MLRRAGHYSAYSGSYGARGTHPASGWVEAGVWQGRLELEERVGGTRSHGEAHFLPALGAFHSALAKKRCVSTVPLGTRLVARSHSVSPPRAGSANPSVTSLLVMAYCMDVAEPAVQPDGGDAVIHQKLAHLRGWKGSRLAQAAPCFAPHPHPPHPPTPPHPQLTLDWPSVSKGPRRASCRPAAPKRIPQLLGNLDNKGGARLQPLLCKRLHALPYARHHLGSQLGVNGPLQQLRIRHQVGHGPPTPVHVDACRSGKGRVQHDVGAGGAGRHATWWTGPWSMHKHASHARRSPADAVWGTASQRLSSGNPHSGQPAGRDEGEGEGL